MNACSASHADENKIDCNYIPFRTIPNMAFIRAEDFEYIAFGQESLSEFRSVWPNFNTYLLYTSLFSLAVLVLSSKLQA